MNGKFFNSGVFSGHSLTPLGLATSRRFATNTWVNAIADRFRTGGIYNLKPTRLVATDDGVYFKKTIVVHGKQFSVWLDGYQVTDFADTRKDDPNPRNGYYSGPGKIALQSHDPTTNLDFKNIRIAELPTGK